ncbi:MAG: hypothetical protein WC325_07450 [Candidatus Bathyarchaeia archaeon]|jgi:hypothetical protein
MIKKRIASFCILVTLTIITISFMINVTNADIMTLQWGHLAPNYYDEDEKDLEEYVCDYIYDLFDNDYLGSWGPLNVWWTYTTDDVMEICMDWENNATHGVTFVANWWLGDYFADRSSQVPFGNFWFYGHDGNHIEDTQVYGNATTWEGNPVSSKQYFNFIWTCSNGGLYWYTTQGSYDNISGIMYPISGDPGTPPVVTPTNTNDEYGFFNNTITVGMPLAWTGISNMNIDGYTCTSGDYCYIGFECASPFMQNYLNGTQVQAYNFPIAFYEFALGEENPLHFHRSTSASLDDASYETFGCYFSDSAFCNGYWIYTDLEGTEYDGWWYCRMRVLGNGARVMPYS